MINKYLLTEKFNAFVEEILKLESIKEINNHYYHTYPTDVFCGIDFQPEVINKLKIYRTRVLDLNKEAEYLLRTYSYPPPILCKTNGRCNVAYQPVFYGTGSVQGAVFEQKLTEGTTFYFTEWTINSDRVVRLSPMYSDELPDNNPWKPLLQNAEIAYKGELEYMENKDELIFNHELMSEHFKVADPPYNLTSFVGTKTIYKQNMDLFVYPCRSIDYNDCSIAIHPNFADSYLRLNRVWKLTYKSFTNLSWHKVGNVVGGNILWRGAQEMIEEDFDIFQQHLTERVLVTQKNDESGQ